MKITILNIDDVIRAEKRKLREAGEDSTTYVMHWGKAELEILNKFANQKINEIFGYMGIYHCMGKSVEGYIITKR